MKIFLSKSLFIFVVIFSNFVYAAENKASLKLITEIFAPFQYQEGKKNKGIAIEIVKAIQKEIQDNSKIKVYPWSRGVRIVSKKKNAALFSMLRTPEREDKYQWIGPLTSMKMVFFKRTGSDIQIKNMEDAKKVNKVGVTRNVGNHQMMISKGFKNLDVLQEGADEQNIKKLVKGRIDLWPSLKMAGLYQARKMGLTGQIEAVEDVVAFSGDMYIAVNKDTDQQLIQKWQDAFDRLKKQGVIDKIIETYL
ncbi:MAG: ABC transporter substrate-binding protein [Gammaproteobacteria bacterium]|nr:ABC transporter substrate-binding protein [Gammaproteobacteria bacterium]